MAGGSCRICVVLCAAILMVEGCQEGVGWGWWVVSVGGYLSGGRRVLWGMAKARVVVCDVGLVRLGLGGGGSRMAGGWRAEGGHVWLMSCR